MNFKYDKNQIKRNVQDQENMDMSTFRKCAMGITGAVRLTALYPFFLVYLLIERKARKRYDPEKYKEQFRDLFVEKTLREIRGIECPELKESFRLQVEIKNLYRMAKDKATAKKEENLPHSEVDFCQQVFENPVIGVSKVSFSADQSLRSAGVESFDSHEEVVKKLAIQAMDGYGDLVIMRSRFIYTTSGGLRYGWDREGHARISRHEHTEGVSSLYLDAVEQGWNLALE